LKNIYRSSFSKWPPQYCTNSTLSDFNAISYVGRLWCPELIPDIEYFYQSPFSKWSPQYRTTSTNTSNICSSCVGVQGGNVWLQMACTIYKINNIILK
jgi:hypothetical protein